MEELIKQLMSQMNNRFDKLEQETGQMNIASTNLQSIIADHGAGSHEPSLCFH